MSDEFAAFLKGLLTICVGALAFMFKKQYERLDDHDDRLNEIEKKVPALATKEDITDLRDRVDENINTLRHEMTEQHRALLSALVKDQR